MRAAVLALIAGCGRFNFSTTTDAAVVCAWSTPVPLPGLSSSATDWEPARSPDGTRMVFSSDRTGPFRIYVSQPVGGGWSAPQQVDLGVSTADYGPVWNATGTRLYFVSLRNGSVPQLLVSAFDGISFGAPAIVPGLENHAANSGALASDELELFLTSSSLPNDLLRATRPDLSSPWQLSGAVDELNTPENEGWPTLSMDGLVMYLEVTRAAETSIHVATRPARDQPWTRSVEVIELEIAGAEDGDPDLAFGDTLFMGSDRAEFGNPDLYEATRECR